MTEWKYLPETDYRINLWRNTIQLFHEIRRPHFVGPFKAAGLNYVVDRPFLTTQGNEQRPDIVASGEGGWLILELTANLKSKKIQFDKYRMIDPRYLSSYGLYPHENKPDIMSSRLTHIDDGSYCQILVKDFLVLKNEEYLDNQYLKDELIKAKGIDLRKLPEIPITLVPEMVKYHLEIRRGLILITIPRSSAADGTSHNANIF